MPKNNDACGQIQAAGFLCRYLNLRPDPSLMQTMYSPRADTRSVPALAGQGLCSCRLPEPDIPAAANPTGAHRVSEQNRQKTRRGRGGFHIDSISALARNYPVSPGVPGRHARRNRRVWGDGYAPLHGRGRRGRAEDGIRQLHATVSRIDSALDKGCSNGDFDAVRSYKRITPEGPAVL